MSIRFSCPSCLANYTVDDEHVGRKVQCQKCGQRLQVPGPPRNRTVMGELQPPAPATPAPVPQGSTAKPRPKASATIPANNGPIRFECPHCRTAYTVNRINAGKSMDCRECQQEMTVPTTGTPILQAPMPTPPEPTPESEAAPDTALDQRHESDYREPEPERYDEQPRDSTPEQSRLFPAYSSGETSPYLAVYFSLGGAALSALGFLLALLTIWRLNETVYAMYRNGALTPSGMRAGFALLLIGIILSVGATVGAVILANRKPGRINYSPVILAGAGIVFGLTCVIFLEVVL